MKSKKLFLIFLFGLFLFLLPSGCKADCLSYCNGLGFTNGECHGPLCHNYDCGDQCENNVAQNWWNSGGTNGCWWPETCWCWLEYSNVECDRNFIVAGYSYETGGCRMLFNTLPGDGAAGLTKGGCAYGEGTGVLFAQCELNKCYSSSGYNGEDCTVFRNCTNDWENSPVNFVEREGTYWTWSLSDAYFGKWDASNKQCVRCGGSKKTYKYGDTTSLSYVTCFESVLPSGNIPDTCESACGADTACDEISDGSQCTVGKYCEALGRNCQSGDKCSGCICVPPSTYTLTVNSTPITGIPITGGPTTYSGTTLYTKTNISAATLIALTAPLTFGSYSFSNWSGCASSFNQTLSFLMPSSNTTCTANYTFTPPPGCNISGYNYANGTCNGQCQYCDISKSTIAWSNVPSGQVCVGNSLHNVNSQYYCGTPVGTCSDAIGCNGSMLYKGCYQGSCSNSSNYGYTDTADDSACNGEICSSTDYCRNSCAWYTGKKCSSGSCTQGYGGGNCNLYTCSGSSCTTICSKSCGATCESDADCPGSTCDLVTCTCLGAPPVFDFSISVNPDSGSVAQGGSTSPSTVTVGLISGTAQSVSFYISGLPSGASPSFSPPSCSPPCNSSMVISTSATTTPTGTYTLLVFGTNGPLSHYYLYTLNVTEAGTVISPPLATTTSATNITQTSATLNGTLTNMGGATSCLVWFEWGTTGTEGVSGSYGNKTTPVSMTATGSIPPVIISGLTSGQTYYFEAFAKNGGSW